MVKKFSWRSLILVLLGSAVLFGSILFVLDLLLYDRAEKVFGEAIGVVFIFCGSIIVFFLSLNIIKKLYGKKSG